MTTSNITRESKPSGYSDPARVFIELSASHQQAAVRMTRIAFGALFVAALSLIGNLYQAQLPRELPYVLHQSSNGSTDIGALLRPATRPDVPWIKYQLARWITEARSVSSDPHVQSIFNAHTALLLLNGSPATSIVAQYYQHQAPTGRRVGVKMNYIRPRQDNDQIYEVDWTETIIDARGQTVANEHWNAMITVAFSAGNITLPSGDDPDYSNPYGMYISDLNWNREGVQ